MTTQDRISLLPDCVLHSILSLIPFKSAVRTSILSRRWRNLWKQLWAYSSILDFGEEFTGAQTPEEFACNVNRLLQLHEGKEIQKFHLFFYPGKRYELDLEKWTRFALAKGVKELDLNLSQGFQCPLNPKYNLSELADITKPSRLPCYTFNFDSITHLNLSLCNIIPPISPLTSLCSLYLRQVNITDDMLKSLLCNCPLLDILTVRECGLLRVIELSSPILHLKSLRVVDCWKASTIVIDAPSLVSFHFYGDLCELAIKNISSLVDAFVSTFDRLGNKIQQDWSFVANLSHVKILTLCSTGLDEIATGIQYTFANFGVITFCNLQELQMLIKHGSELENIYLFFILCHCPFVEKLFVEFPRPRRIYSPSVEDSGIPMEELEEPIVSVFHHLKMIRVKGFDGQDDQMQLVKIFLDYAISLESLVLVAAPLVSESENELNVMKSDSETRMMLIHEKLLLLPKASMDVQIVLCESPEDDNSLCPTHIEVYHSV